MNTKTKLPVTISLWHLPIVIGFLSAAYLISSTGLDAVVYWLLMAFTCLLFFISGVCLFLADNKQSKARFALVMIGCAVISFGLYEFNHRYTEYCKANEFTAACGRTG